MSWWRVISSSKWMISVSSDWFSDFISLVWVSIFFFFFFRCKQDESENEEVVLAAVRGAKSTGGRAAAVDNARGWSASSAADRVVLSEHLDWRILRGLEEILAAELGLVPLFYIIWISIIRCSTRSENRLFFASRVTSVYPGLKKSIFGLVEQFYCTTSAKILSSFWVCKVNWKWQFNSPVQKRSDEKSHFEVTSRYL